MRRLRASRTGADHVKTSCDTKAAHDTVHAMMLGVSNDCLRLRKYVLEKDIASEVLGGGDGHMEDDERAVQGIEYNCNVAIETRPECLPPWPPVSSDTQCAVKIWVSNDLKASRQAHSSSMGTVPPCQG